MKNISKVAVAVFLGSTFGLAFAGGGGMMPVNHDVNWTGPYVGAQVGVQSNRLKRDYSDSILPNISGSSIVTNTGVNGDLMLGYGYQMQNNVYLGLEGLVGFNDIEQKETVTIGSNSYNVENKINPTYGLVANLGYVFNPNLLVYLSGGYANAQVKQVLELASKTENKSGYTLGGGFKTMLTKSIFFTANASYTSLGDMSVSHLTVTEKLTPSYYKVMLGLGYKF